MAYVGFDLDETLGRFSVPDGHLYFLMPEVLYTTQFLPYAPFHQPSDELKTKLTAAFNSFAVCLANKEPALGMLRPGSPRRRRTLHGLAIRPLGGLGDLLVQCLQLLGQLLLTGEQLLEGALLGNGGSGNGGSGGNGGGHLV